MSPAIADFLTASIVASLGALAGAAGIYGEFDDAPGLILIGMVIGVVAIVIGWKALQRRRGAESAG